MTEHPDRTPDVSRSVTVPVGIADAFATFVEHPIDWLPPAHAFLPDASAMTIEPRVGGHFLEHGSDGAQAIRGTVLDWQPPRRIVMTWRIGENWRPINDDAHASHVEVDFHAEAADRTRVVVTHTHLDHHGAIATQIHATIDRPGPGETLTRYAEAVLGHRPRQASALTGTSPHPQTAIIAEFRAHHGRVGGYFANMQLLLLTTTGTRSARAHTVPLTYITDGHGYVVVAANAGSTRSPDWYTNLVADPQARIEIGEHAFTARANVVTGTRREHLLNRFLEANPQLGSYQAATTRPIPVVVLEPDDHS